MLDTQPYLVRILAAGSRRFLLVPAAREMLAAQVLSRALARADNLRDENAITWVCRLHPEPTLRFVDYPLWAPVRKGFGCTNVTLDLKGEMTLPGSNVTSPRVRSVIAPAWVLNVAPIGDRLFNGV